MTHTHHFHLLIEDAFPALGPTRGLLRLSSSLQWTFFQSWCTCSSSGRHALWMNWKDVGFKGVYDQWSNETRMRGMDHEEPSMSIDQLAGDHDRSSESLLGCSLRSLMWSFFSCLLFFFMCWCTWRMSKRSFTMEEADCMPGILLEQTTSTCWCQSGVCIQNNYSKIGCRRTHVFKGWAGCSYLQSAFLPCS